MQKRVNKNFLLTRRREGAACFNFQYSLRLRVCASEVIRAVAEFSNGL
jgi:hypothetical protein